MFKGFIRTLEKQDNLTHEFDAGIWSSLVQEVIVKAKGDIRFIFKNGFEVRVWDYWKVEFKKTFFIKELFVVQDLFCCVGCGIM